MLKTFTISNFYNNDTKNCTYSEDILKDNALLNLPPIKNVSKRVF